MLIALKSAHKAHSMSYYHGMRYALVKIYSTGSPNGGAPTHIMYFHDVNKQILQTNGILWPPPTMPPKVDFWKHFNVVGALA